MKRRAYARVCISCRSPRVVFAMHRSHSCCDVMQSLCTPPLHCACEEFTRHLFGMSMLPGAFPFAMRLVQLLWAGPHRHGRICTRRCGSICLSAIQVSRHVCRPRRLPNLVCPAFGFVCASVLFSAAMSHVTCVMLHRPVLLVPTILHSRALPVPLCRSAARYRGRASAAAAFTSCH